jgi:hypothetical protein
MGMGNGLSHVKSLRLNNTVNVIEGTAETPKLKFVDRREEFLPRLRLKTAFAACLVRLRRAHRTFLFSRRKGQSSPEAYLV